MKLIFFRSIHSNSGSDSCCRFPSSSLKFRNITNPDPTICVSFPSIGAHRVVDLTMNPAEANVTPMNFSICLFNWAKKVFERHLIPSTSDQPMGERSKYETNDVL